MVADVVAEKRKKLFCMDMVADMEVDKVADKVAENKEKIDIDINTEIQFGERFGHGGWLVWTKLFRPEAFSACASSSFASLFFLFKLKL